MVVMKDSFETGLRMLSDMARHPAFMRALGRHDATGDARAGGGVIHHAILLAPQQGTLPETGPSTRARKRPFIPKKAVTTPASARAAHERRGQRYLPEDRDAAQKMQRHAQLFHALDLDNDVQPVTARGRRPRSRHRAC